MFLLKLLADYESFVTDLINCASKIKTHLEELFSDSHLAEDGFLLKHVQKNKQGFVSLKLLTSLKKIRTLTKNWYMTLVGALYSDLLEVNDESTKVRRIEPLPKWLLCSPTSKLLLAWNFSEEQSSEDLAARGPDAAELSENVLQKFSIYGRVTSVQILPPGRELPADLQCYGKRHKQLGLHLCAVIKFDSLETVRKAYSALKAEEEKSNGKGMCVVPMGFQSMHHFTEDESQEEASQVLPEKEENPPEIPENLVREENSLPTAFFDEPPDTHQPKASTDNPAPQNVDPISSSCNGQSLPGWNHNDSRMTWNSGDCDKEISQSPWVLKRKLAALKLNRIETGQPSAPSSMQRVIRQPFGPDGTSGFQFRARHREQLDLPWKK
uniref:La ribonucleoprotein 6, translational regulator b n=1 Tax=Oreochromis niloticus TaxID=8128 RepID=A0A669CXT9_ORENI